MSVTVTFTNPKEIVDELMNFVGSSACSMESTVLVKHNKNSRVSGSSWDDVFGRDVYKTYTEHGNIGINYENAVNNQRKREASEDAPAEKFTASSLPWGQWVKENLIIEHKDNYYIRYYSGMNANSGLGDVIYHYEDGTELTEAEVEALKGFLPPKKTKKIISKEQYIIKMDALVTDARDNVANDVPLARVTAELITALGELKNEVSTTQGVEKVVKPKNLKLNGLSKLTVGGKTYIRK